MARGRIPSPQRLVESLDASELAKRRLTLILMTLARRCTVAEAAVQLGVSQAAFYAMRNQALQRFVERLEPRRRGRPSKQPPAAETLALADEVERLTGELTIAQVREQIALAMPHLVPQPPADGSAGDLKKTTSLPRKQRPRKHRSRKGRRSGSR